MALEEEEAALEEPPPQTGFATVPETRSPPREESPLPPGGQTRANPRPERSVAVSQPHRQRTLLDAGASKIDRDDIRDVVVVHIRNRVLIGQRSHRIKGRRAEGSIGVRQAHAELAGSPVKLQHVVPAVVVEVHY